MPRRWWSWSLNKLRNELRTSFEDGEWGVPDWSDPNNSVEYGDISDEQSRWDNLKWRWEFIRRRDDYRSDFFMCLQKITPESVIVEEDGYIYGLKFRHQNASKYGLRLFLDPSISIWRNDDPIIEFQLGDGLIYGCRCNECDEENNRFLTLTFDFDMPIDNQIESAKAYLFSRRLVYNMTNKKKKIRHAAKRQHMNKWPLYLRVIDAKNSGASLSDIASILPVTMAVRDRRAAANVVEQALKQAVSF